MAHYMPGKGMGPMGRNGPMMGPGKGMGPMYMNGGPAGPVNGIALPSFFETLDKRREKYDSIPPADNPPNETLYVNNLRSSINPTKLKEELMRLFSKIAKPLDIVCMKSVKRRGQAWVVYKKESLAKKAMQRFQGHRIFGQPMRIAYALTKSDAFIETQPGMEPRKKAPSRAPPPVPGSFPPMPPMPTSMPPMPDALPPMPEGLPPMPEGMPPMPEGMPPMPADLPPQNLEPGNVLSFFK